jgi:pSer/pThr/pTyr-binding forkhead associated (FHA) protein
MVYAAEGEQTPDPVAEPKRRAVMIVDGKRLVVPTGGAVIGRSRDSDIVLADSNVSRRHAQISPAPGGWTVEDLGSTNGVRVNGRAVNGRQAIRSGDQLEIGTVQARFEEA